MALDPQAMARALTQAEAVVRVAVLSVRGSAPRGAGTEMLVWPGGQWGTIGGGALEWQAVQTARARMDDSAPLVQDWPLGPNLGQCCGGAVRLLWERYSEVPALPHSRQVAGQTVTDAAPALPALWVWGAGHIGRAIVPMAAPLFEITWVDYDQGCFPPVPPGVTALPAAAPERLLPHVPAGARHVVVTRAHDLDLALCAGLLGAGAGHIALIGSATKWARFQSRLRAMGHGDLGAIRCPAGDPGLGRTPQAIALGIVTALVRDHLGGDTI